MIGFYCIDCHQPLEKKVDSFVCGICGFKINLDSGVWCSSNINEEKHKNFYDNIYNSEKGKKWFRGLNRNIFKVILEKFSITYARERFFKKWLKGKDNLILDLACGAGRDYFSNFGEVVGVDLSFSALQLAKNRYQTVLQSGVAKLPFADNTFDFVVSSDFFGHVLNEDKDVIIKEIKRVLKPEGKTLHLIETDSNNPWFRVARRDPILFNRYFVEQIGGHIGLELPTALIKRWQKQDFVILLAHPIWGLIWPVRHYLEQFNNEYRKYWQINILYYFANFFSYFKLTEILVNILLCPINFLVNKISPINWGQGIFLVAEKEDK